MERPPLFPACASFLRPAPRPPSLRSVPGELSDSASQPSPDALAVGAGIGISPGPWCSPGGSPQMTAPWAYRNRVLETFLLCQLSRKPSLGTHSAREKLSAWPVYRQR